MEEFKEKIPMIIAFVVVIMLIFGAYYILFVHKDIYYTQIDNTKIEKISSSDDMKYQYTLIAYDKSGKEKEIEFKTSRELKEDAYLELEIMVTRGVVNWKEVEVNELPDRVKEKTNIKQD